MPHHLDRPVSDFAALIALCWACAICCSTAEASYCGCEPQNHAPQHLPSTFGNNSTSSEHKSIPASRNAIRIDDMLISAEDFEVTRSSSASSGRIRYVLRPEDFINCRRLWPNGTLYYRFSTDYPNYRRNLIRSALQKLSERTDRVVNFEEVGSRFTEQHVTVGSMDGCWSYVGRQNSEDSTQQMSLEAGCTYEESIIQHEFMHALGFHHEQSRWDRDDYVRIIWENIESDKCSNFEKNPFRIPSDFPSYDYNSIMHYTSNAFSCGWRQPTIAVKNGGSTIDVRNRLSVRDVEKLKYIYSPENLKYCLGSIYNNKQKAFDT